VTAIVRFSEFRDLGNLAPFTSQYIGILGLLVNKLLYVL